jgi:hypothetical protein
MWFVASPTGSCSSGAMSIILVSGEFFVAVFAGILISLPSQEVLARSPVRVMAGKAFSFGKWFVNEVRIFLLDLVAEGAEFLLFSCNLECVVLYVNESVTTITGIREKWTMKKAG